MFYIVKSDYFFVYLVINFIELCDIHNKNATKIRITKTYACMCKKLIAQPTR